MKYNLFLDDIRHPYDCISYMKDPGIYAKWEWVIVRNYDEFVSIITEKGMPDIISFDHDLADEHYSKEMYEGTEEYNKKYEEFKEKTGLDCAKWLCDYCMDYRETLPEFVVHSMNPAGGKNISSYLESFKKFQSEY
jgi:hypothetical protein